MIQDIAPKKYDNHYEEQNPADEDWMLVYKDGQILCRFDQEKIYFPKVKETGWKGKDVTYLFTISGERFFLLRTGRSVTRVSVGKTSDLPKCKTSVSWVCRNHRSAAG